MEFVYYALVLLILMAVVLCFYAILAVKKLTETLSSMQVDLHTLIDKTLPVLENLDQAIDKINGMSSDLERKIYQIDKFVHTVKERIVSLVDFKDNVMPQNPILKLLKNLSALQKGISVFWTKMKEN
ncbi:MAG: DUF948 domain-containing protein [bacterium]